MLEANDLMFPNNIVLALHGDLASMFPADPADSDPGVQVFMRPLKDTDPNTCIGVSATLWMPDEDSYELGGGIGRTGPSVNNYIIALQCFVKHMDEVPGLALSATLATAVRNRINLAVNTRSALSQLSHEAFGYRETFSRATIQAQRFVSNEIQGQFLHLSSMELRVETQVNSM